MADELALYAIDVRLGRPQSLGVFQGIEGQCAHEPQFTRRPLFRLSGRFNKRHQVLVVTTINPLNAYSSQSFGLQHLHCNGNQDLGGGVRASKFKPAKNTIRLLEKRYGHEITEIFGIEPAAVFWTPTTPRKPPTWPSRRSSRKRLFSLGHA